MDINLDELRKLADAATPGPWKWDGYQLISEEPSLNYGSRIILDAEEGTVYSEYSADSASIDVTPENIAHIAAFDPPTVLSLLAEIERLRGEVNCPIGLDDAREICSYSACVPCMIDRAKDVVARAERAESDRDRAVEALRAAKGYLLNAKIDLDTGATKRTASNTIDGGLRMVDAALSPPQDTGKEQADKEPSA